MSKRERRILEGIYRRSQREEDLPWHRTDPMPLLKRVVEERQQAERALDLGCGTGNDAVYLARQGYAVTGVDYLERPLQMAREHAQAQGVEITLVRADVLTWEAAEPFDLIIDAGCLHSLNSSDRATYRNRLMKWLAPGGDYVLFHFGKRHLLDWRPRGIGPRRRRRKDVVREFGPDFVERAYAQELQRNALPVGPISRIDSYWFQRAKSAT